ncbi:MAG: hypothetical protein KGJ86_10405 [Chloroflexota bacterium]|nr:hypothetical protein [Chloroflexota bacterium]
MRAGGKVDELSAAEHALLTFVRKAAGSPSSITAEDIQELRDQGWGTEEMIEALSVVMSTAFGNTLSIALRLQDDLESCGMTDYF